jgi:Mg2+ and Co2+ transporter CorA
MEIILAVATFSIMPFNLLAGVLGENLVIPEQITGAVSQFYVVNAVATLCCVTVFYSIFYYMKYRRLI